MERGSEDPDKYRSLLDPFRGWGPQEIQEAVDDFLKRSQLYSFDTDIRRGAVLAQDPEAFLEWEEVHRSEGKNVFAGDVQRIPGIFEDEKSYLMSEQGYVGDPDLPRQEQRPSYATTTGPFLKERTLWKQFLLGWRQYWNQHPLVHALVACCSLGAAIQGWDESAVNGAQVEYNGTDALRVPDRSVLGLLNSAPYLMCVFSCLLTEPLNKVFGRKGTIIFTSLFSFASCLGQAFVSDWRQLLACRLLLGFGIGPKTATIPIYAAESVPELCRGAMVMQWQLWTAFGIMAGLITSYIFRDVGLTWRIMLGSPLIPAAALLFLMLSMPESPRWFLLKGHREENPAKQHLHYEHAFRSLWRMRYTKLQAARDLFLLDRLLQIELDLVPNGDMRVKPAVKALKVSLEKHKALWTHDRCRRAMIAVLVVMIFQQLSGINVLTYYSSTVFMTGSNLTGGKSNNCTSSIPTIGGDNKQAIESIHSSFGYSMGMGAVNFMLGLPALFLIDTIGRRALLLLTFPIMSGTLFVTAFAYLERVCSVRENLVRWFCFLFMAVYSIGEGPVPLVYASESLPLVVRDTGIGVATAIYWGFNFLVAMTWLPIYNPNDSNSKVHGVGFGVYGIFCLLGFFAVLMFVPETKRLHLEQVDTAFSMPYSKVIPERYAGILKPIRWRFMTKNKNKKQSMQFEGSSRKDIESDVD